MLLQTNSRGLTLAKRSDGGVFDGAEVNARYWNFVVFLLHSSPIGQTSVKKVSSRGIVRVDLVLISACIAKL